ncbi:MAG TPA: hypothetical protein VEK57_00265 [Thermoanaerobaculia bacterium]|nr:hypothetical protein [Thermoanaerobaculia bacterium]
MRVRFRFAAMVCAVSLLLAGCEIEDDLQIREDGSGTYRVKVLVRKVLASSLGRIRAEAAREGFRIVDEGKTADRQFIVFQKDFDHVSSLRDAQSNFDWTTERRGLFKREYRLRATVSSVAAENFSRRFTVVMPAEVKSNSDGARDGARVTWFCASGGTIEIVSEGWAFPVSRNVLFAASAAAGFVLLLLLVVLLRVRRRGTAAAAAEITCRTCRGGLTRTARYCPACGDLAPPPA